MLGISSFLAFLPVFAGPEPVVLAAILWAIFKLKHVQPI